MYKPAPSPYEAREVLKPDSSVRKYSFKILEPAAPKVAPAEPEPASEEPTSEIDLRAGELAEEARQSRILIEAIEPQTDFVEEISTEGDFFLLIYIIFSCYFTVFTHCTVD